MIHHFKWSSVLFGVLYVCVCHEIRDWHIMLASF